MNSIGDVSSASVEGMSNTTTSAGTVNRFWKKIQLIFELRSSVNCSTLSMEVFVTFENLVFSCLFFTLASAMLFGFANLALQDKRDKETALRVWKLARMSGAAGMVFSGGYLLLRWVVYLLDGMLIYGFRG